MAVMRETTNGEIGDVHLIDVSATNATNVNIPGLWHVTPTDVTRLTSILQNAWRIKEVWDDDARANPGLWFMSHYTKTENMLFDVLNGAGLVAFIRTTPSWRTQVFAAAWARRAKGRDDLFRSACTLMMYYQNLHVIDSFVRLDNPLSQRATLRAGFKNRGIIRDAQCYHGAMIPMWWNEIDRATLGVEIDD